MFPLSYTLTLYLFPTLDVPLVAGFVNMVSLSIATGPASILDQSILQMTSESGLLFQAIIYACILIDLLVYTLFERALSFAPAFKPTLNLISNYMMCLCVCVFCVFYPRFPTISHMQHLRFLTVSRGS